MASSKASSKYSIFAFKSTVKMKYYLQPRIRISEYTPLKGYPIYLRYSCAGEEAWKNTNVFVAKKEHWNDKLKMIMDGPYFRQKNKLIEKERSEAEERLMQAVLTGEGPSIKAFKGLMLESFEKYIHQVDKSSPALGLVKHLKAFYNDKMPRIEQVTVRLLNQFEDYMLSVAELAHNSMVGYMAVMQKVLNQAVRESYITKSPFDKGLYKRPARGETSPVYLVTEQREMLFNGLLNKTKDLSADTYRVLAYFVFACYTGLRYSDWPRFDYQEHVRDGFMNIRAKKNKRLITREIEAGSNLEKILKIIKSVGPLTTPYSSVLDHLDVIQEVFGLPFQLTTHVGRHSFGYFCASLGLEKQITATLMGITIKTVEVYYHLTGKHVVEQSKKLTRA